MCVTETSVGFFASYSGYAVAPTIGNPMIFNTVPYKTDDSYSTSTGIYTCPQNGTYYFRTTVTGDQDPSALSISVNGQVISSSYAYDDYNLNQATAYAIVQLNAGDEVSVVKKTGSSIFGYYPNVRPTMRELSSFLGYLLW